MFEEKKGKQTMKGYNLNIFVLIFFSTRIDLRLNWRLHRGIHYNGWFTNTSGCCCNFVTLEA